MVVTRIQRPHAVVRRKIVLSVQDSMMNIVPGNAWSTNLRRVIEKPCISKPYYIIIRAVPLTRYRMDEFQSGGARRPASRCCLLSLIFLMTLKCHEAVVVALLTSISRVRIRAGCEKFRRAFRSFVNMCVQHDTGGRSLLCVPCCPPSMSSDITWTHTRLRTPVPCRTAAIVLENASRHGTLHVPCIGLSVSNPHSFHQLEPGYHH